MCFDPRAELAIFGTEPNVRGTCFNAQCRVTTECPEDQICQKGRCLFESFQCVGLIRNQCPDQVGWSCAADNSFSQSNCAFDVKIGQLGKAGRDTSKDLQDGVSGFFQGITGGLTGGRGLGGISLGGLVGGLLGTPSSANNEPANTPPQPSQEKPVPKDW